jgi:hypothetical protein
MRSELSPSDSWLATQRLTPRATGSDSPKARGNESEESP